MRPRWWSARRRSTGGCDPEGYADLTADDEALWDALDEEYFATVTDERIAASVRDRLRDIAPELAT